jgi:hypothetical protein
MVRGKSCANAAVATTESRLAAMVAGTRRNFILASRMKFGGGTI